MKRNLLRFIVLIGMFIAALFIVTKYFSPVSKANHVASHIITHPYTFAGTLANGLDGVCFAETYSSNWQSYSGQYFRFPDGDPGNAYEVREAGLVNAPCSEHGADTAGRFPAGLPTTGNVQLWSANPCPTYCDTTPPTISNLTAGSITQTGATISWTTNESTTNLIQYGTSPSTWGNYPSSATASSGTSPTKAL